MRVPTVTLYSRLEQGLGKSLGRVQSLQTELASGSRINKLSDDPVGAAQALRLRAQETDWSAYTRTADDARATLDTTDGVLQTSSTLLRRVNDLSIGAVNGALGTVQRTVIADEIRDLREQLADLANTTHLGRAVFGGHRASAFVADRSVEPPTWSYAGDDGVVSRQVSPSVTVEVNLDGREVFGFPPAGAPGQDLFSVLGRLEAAVRAGDVDAIRAAQGGLAERTEAVTMALTSVGAKTNRVESAAQLGRESADRLLEHRSRLEDVDYAATIMRLHAAEGGYQAALGAVSRANLPSLANFLR